MPAAIDDEGEERLDEEAAANAEEHPGAEAVISERAEFLVGHALGGIGGDRMAS